MFGIFAQMSGRSANHDVLDYTSMMLDAKAGKVERIREEGPKTAKVFMYDG